MARTARVVNWNGKTLSPELRALLPPELRELPDGRYVVEEYEQTAELTAEEEEGLRQAIGSIRAGHGRPAAEVHARLDDLLNRRL